MVAWKEKRRILLGVSGGISAYKVPDFVRALRNGGNEVDCILTEAAERFVSPMVLATLSERRVWLDRDFLSDDGGPQIPHIRLAERAEVCAVVPCTAETLRRIAQGEAGTLLGATLLALRAPVLLFPAMNVHMWDHPATRASVIRCRELGYRVIEPEEGYLACGYEGRGRLPSRDVILEELWRALSPKRDLEGVRVLVTAGPTLEFLDPVRFLSNPSSGKMGYAMARTAWYRGAEVCLVTGPVSLDPPPGVECIRITSAGEMYDVVMRKLEWATVIVKAAAVGDYRAAQQETRKIKREVKERLCLDLEQNPDIAAAVGSRKRADQFLLGFAAETEDLIDHAQSKMRRKGLNMIVANSVSGQHNAFGAEDNRVVVIDENGVVAEISGTKESVADCLWDEVGKRLPEKGA